VSLATQLPALLGVVVGAVTAFLGTALIDRARWRREQSVRWDARRLDAYITYAAAIKRNSTAVAQVLAGRGLIKSIRSTDADTGLVELAEAEADRSEAFEGVLLLGDTATIAAGTALNRQVWRMQAFARAELPIDARVWGEAFHRYREARTEFHSRARDSMGVPSASLPLGSAWLDAARDEAEASR
jgi:hypothetical protein